MPSCEWDKVGVKFYKRTKLVPRTQKLGEEFQKFKKAHLKIFHVHLALLERLLQKLRRMLFSDFSIFYAETSEILKRIRVPMKKIRESINTIWNASFNTVPVIRKIESLEDFMKKHDLEVLERVHLAELACIAIERLTIFDNFIGTKINWLKVQKSGQKAQFRRHEQLIEESLNRNEALARTILQDAKVEEEKLLAVGLDDYQEVLQLAQNSRAAFDDAHKDEGPQQAQQENGGNN
ncbi:hypothetical protein B9Z55_027669 [Caenorhabditis nigoni]|uniref:Uncharacterized protein n=1 Tax=Caenorhabditis nigoni TaxID=1611254 RepID=A0A2G5SFA3_9PELO|nr:hypothetical protein B9Z55_027669 [Caenorhabditis nigoni]